MAEPQLPPQHPGLPARPEPQFSLWGDGRSQSIVDGTRSLKLLMLHSSRPINTHAFDYFPALKKVRAYFEENYSAPISIKKAAAVAGLEEKYFSRMFRCRVGIGFKEWTDLVRVQKAVAAMRKEDQSLISVGLAVGFQSSVTFQRQFKKYTRMQPREFRKIILQQLSDGGGISL